MILFFVKVINLNLQLIKHAIIIPSYLQSLGLENKSILQTVQNMDARKEKQKKKAIIITKAFYFKQARSSVK